MYTAPLSHIRKELQIYSQKDLLTLCARLASFSRDNKELLSYLLFESADEQAFIQNLKDEVSQLFQDVNTSSLYLAKKTIRKILRLISKQSRYSGQPQTHIEALLHFCEEMNGLEIAWKVSLVLLNLYGAQIKKIMRLVLTLHEDLQYDYHQRMEGLIME